MKSLGKLVQEINPKANRRIDDETEKLVIYRPRTGEYFYQTSFVDRFFNTSDRHFIVNHHQFEKIEALECEVFDPKANAEIKLKVTCVVGCIKSKAHKLVKIASKSENLHEAIHKLFVNWTNSFIDISSKSIKKDFTEIDGKLRKHYEDYAASRGIRLTIIRIDLDDEIGEFLEGFSFATDVDDDPSYKEDTYQTKEADVDVCLRLNVSGKGESLGGNLSKHNRKGKSLIKEIKLQTIEFIRRWMREISPEEIYMSDRDKKLDELGQDLADFYHTEFNVDNPKFSISVLDTEPKIRVENLMSHEGEITIRDATNTIKYDIIYSVVGVSNWSKFILRQKRYYGRTDEEYQTISKLMKHEMERVINHEYGAKIEWLKTENFDEFMRDLYKKSATQVIDDQYGLILGTPNLNRLTIKEEEAPIHEGMTKLDIQKKKRKELLKRLEQAEMADDEEEIEEIEQKLKIVSDKISSIRKTLPRANYEHKKIESNEEHSN